MGLLKPTGKNATESRKGTTHGSTVTRRMGKHGGQIQRCNEKPAWTPRRGRGR